MKTQSFNANNTSWTQIAFGDSVADTDSGCCCNKQSEEYKYLVQFIQTGLLYIGDEPPTSADRGLTVYALQSPPTNVEFTRNKPMKMWVKSQQASSVVTIVSY